MPGICFEEYGQKVNYWVTINEPNYETLCCYGFGNYPPNVKDLGRQLESYTPYAPGKCPCRGSFPGIKAPGNGWSCQRQLSDRSSD